MQQQVEETIEVIRPALQADGGDIVLKEVDEVTGKKSKTKANPSNVDTSTGRKNGNRSPLLGDPAVADKLLGSVTKTTVQNASGAVYVNGVAFNKPKG